MKVLLLFVLIISLPVKADPLLATHLILNTIATKYFPEYAGTTYHGSFMALDYGYRYEQGEPFKLGAKTKGSHKPSYGIRLGYQFLRSETHKLAAVYSRKYAHYEGKTGNESEDVIDSFGMRFNIGVMAFKFGWSSHKFEYITNQYDAGVYTGIGFDFYIGKYSLYMDLTSHYLEEREQHLAGGDIGIRYSFGDVNE